MTNFEAVKIANETEDERRGKEEGGREGTLIANFIGRQLSYSYYTRSPDFFTSFFFSKTHAVNADTLKLP